MTFKVSTEDSNNDFVGRNKCKAMELRRDSLKASFESVCVYISVFLGSVYSISIMLT